MFLRKNYLLKRRNLLDTLIEILAPVIAALVLWAIRNKVPPTEINQDLVLQCARTLSGSFMLQTNTNCFGVSSSGPVRLLSTCLLIIDAISVMCVCFHHWLCVVYLFPCSWFCSCVVGAERGPVAQGGQRRIEAFVTTPAKSAWPCVTQGPPIFVCDQCVFSTQHCAYTFV
jgi:hypothetical protein